MPTIPVQCRTCGFETVYSGPLEALAADIDAGELLAGCPKADPLQLLDSAGCPDLLASLTAERTRLFPTP